uniref:Uncharacterized protein n=1 Tax=Picea sitchensis TaxID=3332 RepID=A9NN02_PICSI|nr:unknown [Picea sitchensis]
MKRFTGSRRLRSASNSSRLKIMIKCRKRSDASDEIENFNKKKNTNKTRSRDVVPLTDRASSNGVAEITEKIDDQDEIVACDERCGHSGARERLQNYRLQVAGNVWIPDTWGYEDRLKDWADPNDFDIHSNGLVMQSARTALIEDCGRREPAAAILPT